MSRALLVSDLDGTLINREHSFSPEDLHALIRLKKAGILRAIATGRSLFSARQVLDHRGPAFIDYLIFSSGAGIFEWPGGRLLKSESLDSGQVRGIVNHLLAWQVDFMVHRPVPGNHHFVYFTCMDDNPDFYRRLQIYRDFAEQGNPSDPFGGSTPIREASQVLIVLPPDQDAPGRIQQLKETFPHLSVLRATSPIDDRSVWIEIFPKSVSKAQAAEYVRRLHQVNERNTAALGNDYNDEDLLEWAHRAFVVAAAPAHLREKHVIVEGGLAEAVDIWTGEMKEFSER
jgi:hypothetical protein